jgi:hypothetical protein
VSLFIMLSVVNLSVVLLNVAAPLRRIKRLKNAERFASATRQKSFIASTPRMRRNGGVQGLQLPGGRFADGLVGGVARNGDARKDEKNLERNLYFKGWRRPSTVIKRCLHK